MEEHDGFGFDEFSVEMEDFEYTQVKKFDRIFNLGDGGSFTQKPLLHKSMVYVGCLDRNVYKLDAETGELVWKFTAEGSIGPASPEISDDTIYIGSNDYNLYAIDKNNGSLKWRFHTNGKILANPCMHEKMIFFGSNDFIIYCIDASSGELIWKFKTRGEVPCTPTYYKGMLLCGSYDHFLYCIDANSGRQLWKFEAQGDVFHLPSLLVHDDVVYFPSFDNYLRAVDVNTGKLLWKFKTGSFGGMGTSPVLKDGVLYQVNREGVLHAITLKGKELWKFKINNAMAHPIIHGDEIFFGTEENYLYCVGTDGKLRWKFQTQGMMWWQPTVWEGKIYFTSWDCFLYCVDIKTHSLLWKFRGQGSPSYSPPPFDSFELRVKKAATGPVLEERGSRKKYDINITESESPSQYKSRVTYQMSTHYQSKGGKYQVDSDEEAL